MEWHMREGSPAAKAGYPAAVHLACKTKNISQCGAIHPEKWLVRSGATDPPAFPELIPPRLFSVPEFPLREEVAEEHRRTRRLIVPSRHIHPAPSGAVIVLLWPSLAPLTSHCLHVAEISLACNMALQRACSAEGQRLSSRFFERNTALQRACSAEGQRLSSRSACNTALQRACSAEGQRLSSRFFERNTAPGSLCRLPGVPAATQSLTHSPRGACSSADLRLNSSMISQLHRFEHPTAYSYSISRSSDLEIEYSVAGVALPVPIARLSVEVRRIRRCRIRSSSLLTLDNQSRSLVTQHTKHTSDQKARVERKYSEAVQGRSCNDPRSRAGKALASPLLLRVDSILWKCALWGVKDSLLSDLLPVWYHTGHPDRNLFFEGTEALRLRVLDEYPSCLGKDSIAPEPGGPCMACPPSPSNGIRTKAWVACTGRLRAPAA